MLFLRPLIAFLITFLIFMCWNFDLISAATLIKTRSQDETSNKVHPSLQSVRPSVPTPKLSLNVRESQNDLSSSDQQHGKPSIMDITEAPSTTTITYDHYATTRRRNHNKRSILDPQNLPSRYQPGQDAVENGDFESDWPPDGEEEEEEDYGGDYDLPDFTEPNHQLIVDLSIKHTNAVNQNDPGSHLIEEVADDDVILVIGQLSTIQPTTNSFEKEKLSTEHTTQSYVEQESPVQVIGLNGWPLQVGLQARTNQLGTVTKLVDSQMGNENGLQTFLEAQKFNGQQWGNRSEESNSFQGNSERLDIKIGGKIADSHDDSVVPYFVHSQFMNSPVTNSNMANRQINKTKPPEISIEQLEIVDSMMNHYGNPRRNKPTSSTISVPEILRDWYDGSEEENNQKPTTTAEPEEAFYYNNSEEDEDQDLDYSEEIVDDVEPIIRITQNAEIVDDNSRTDTKRPLTTSMGSPPYFVSSAQLEPFHPKIDVSDEIGLMLNPIGVIDGRMDIHSYNGINFVDPPDLIKGSAFVIPFPDDPVIPIRPSLNLNLQQQQQQATTIVPFGRTENFQKNDNFVDTSNRVQPYLTQQSNVITGPNSVPPSTNKDGGPFAYVRQEEIISQHPTEMKNVIKDRLPYPVMTSSSTLTSLPSLSVKSNGVLRNPMDDDVGVTFTPIPTRPFAQSPYVTWGTTKARYGPYFVSSAPTNQQQSGNYNTDQGMRKQAIETIRNPTGTIINKEIERSKSTSANRGRPPYFVTSTTPTPLFQPINLKESTRKPTDIRTSVNKQNFTNNQGTTTNLRPEETKERFETENNFASSGVISGSIQTSPRPQLPDTNIPRPIELTDSSSESDETDQQLVIDIKESVGILPNRIGISNKNNVVVIPKIIDSGNAQAPNTTFQTDLNKIPEPSKLNTSNEQLPITTMIVNHGMGSFVVTSPVPFSVQQMVTHSFEDSATTTVVTVEPPNVSNTNESRNPSYKIETDYAVHAAMEKPLGIVQNPIGISNKNNVFVVPKSTTSIIRPPIISHSFPVDLLIMKRNGLIIDNEQQMLRPFERIVSHQMGSFVVTTNPDANQSFINPAHFIRPDTTTTASIESPFFIGSVEPAQKIGIHNPGEESTSQSTVLVVQKPIGIGNSKSVVRSSASTSSASPGRPPYFAKSTTPEPFQPIYLNQNSMSKLVEEISKIQRSSDNGNLKGDIDPIVLDVIQPSLSSFPTGRFMKPTLNNDNNQQQRMQKTNLRRPSGRAGTRSNLQRFITVSSNITRKPNTNLSPDNKTPKNTTAKSSQRKT